MWRLLTAPGAGHAPHGALPKPPAQTRAVAHFGVGSSLSQHHALPEARTSIRSPQPVGMSSSSPEHDYVAHRFRHKIAPHARGNVKICSHGVRKCQERVDTRRILKALSGQSSVAEPGTSISVGYESSSPGSGANRWEAFDGASRIASSTSALLTATRIRTTVTETTWSAPKNDSASIESVAVTGR